VSKVRRHSPWRSGALRVLGVLVLGAVGFAPAAARAASPLSFSAAQAIDGSGQPPSAISCPSESLCVAVDRAGNALTTTDPAASAPSWSTAAIDPGQTLSSVSCASSALCVAVDARGEALASTSPGGGAAAWSAKPIDGGMALTGISCPTTSLCVAVDASGNVLTSTDPAGTGWTPAVNIDGAGHLVAVSCASSALCVAVDEAGSAFTSTDPVGGAGSWRGRAIDPALAMTAISCSPDGHCVAVDSSGDVLASADPAASAATWSSTSIDANAGLGGVSCASSGLCVTVDSRGAALASDNPTASLPVWSQSSADSAPLAGIFCLPGGFCMAVDTAGRALAGRVPAPAATTLTPTEVTSVGAILAGAVNPNDAVLGACSFEYATGGTGGLYTQSVPCSVLPAATGGIQGVSAQLSGLSPNTTYHYRILASSPAGANAAADVAFTTAVSSQVALVYPHPSITGTPAAGQRLTCHPGTPSGASTRLSYAWLRDLIPIASATGSTYTTKNQDSGHHLQCQVTATDAGGSTTAKSAFVTIPVGGVPASAGETIVGKVAFRGGRVSVPVICSPHASAGCKIALRLSVVEALSAKRIVAIAAHRQSAHGGGASLHHRTVTLASVRVHLAAGAHATLVAALNATGRRLLASKRRFSAYMSVNGTVIGSIESQLTQQVVTLGPSAHHASTHAAHRR